MQHHLLAMLNRIIIFAYVSVCRIILLLFLPSMICLLSQISRVLDQSTSRQHDNVPLHFDVSPWIVLLDVSPWIHFDVSLCFYYIFQLYFLTGNPGICYTWFKTNSRKPLLAIYFLFYCNSILCRSKCYLSIFKKDSEAAILAPKLESIHRK